jgi:nucleoside-diphosphate-sugar epimerase
MKIILTGALGYIGCESLYRLSARPDITVYAVDNDVGAIQDRGAYFLRFPNIKIINCDITDIEQVKQLPKSDIIVHLASIVGYLQCNQNPKLTYNTNVVGTQNIVNLVTPTIFFSTGSVYGEIGSYCDETVAVNPQTVYAKTKHQAEEIIKTIPSVIFRPATAVGLSFKTRHDLLVHDLACQAIKNKHIDLYQPTAMRSFYSVQKLAELIEFACDNFSKFQNNIYNVGCDSGNIMKQDIVKLLEQHVKFTYNIVNGADADTRDYNVNYNKLKEIWSNYDENFSDSIPNIVEYYKNGN